MDLLSKYSEQEQGSRATKILIQVTNTVVKDDVTNVLLYNMLSMFFLGEENNLDYQKALRELYVDKDGNETPLSSWTGDSTVPWFHEEDYERQLTLQGE